VAESGIANLRSLCAGKSVGACNGYMKYEVVGPQAQLKNGWQTIAKKCE